MGGSKIIAAIAAACFAATPPAWGATVVVDPKPLHGTVEDASGQINCGDGGSACTGTYPGSTTEPGGAELTAVPSAGYTFSGWTGACEPQNPSESCSLGFTSNVTRTTSATFADVTPPVVTLTSPTDGALFGPGQTVRMEATASDTTGTVSGVEFLLIKSGALSWTLLDSSAPFAVVIYADSLAEGTWSLVARARDGAGNVTDSAPRTFTVDRTAPTLTVTGPAAYTAEKPQVTIFTAGGDTVGRRCYVDEGPAGPCSASDHHQTLFDAGQHSVGVQVRDAAGNWSPIRLVSFTVDRTAPEVDISSPDDGSSTNADPLHVAFTAGGTGTAIAAAQCRLDSAGFAACDSLSGHAFASLPEGARTLTVRVSDQAGNTAEATRTVVVDRTGPALAITGPAEGATVSVDPVVVSFSSTDSNGVTSRMCQFDGQAAVACNGEGSHTVAGLPEGVRTFTLTATDAAGNVTTVARSFTVDRPDVVGGGTGDAGGTGGTGGAGAGSTGDPPAPGPPGDGVERIASVLTGRWSYSRRYTVARRLRVTAVPGSATVEVRCSTRRRGCAFRRRVIAATGPVVDLTRLVRKRRLKAGAVLEVRVLKAGSVGRVVRYTVRRNRAPKRSELCLPPGAARPAAC